MMEQWLVVSGIYELCSLTQSRLSHSLLYGGGNQLEDGDGEDGDDNDDIVMIIERKHCRKRVSKLNLFHCVLSE